jgi:hypothetical protein
VSATHHFSVPGVVNNGLATVFACTNVSSSDIIVGVEVFGAAGGAALNDASATSLTVAPSGTAMFGTQALAGIVVDRALNVGIVHKGSARILATAKSGVTCSAFLATPESSPPNSMTGLTIVKKTTQQGD